jgi:hypothetical protein
VGALLLQGALAHNVDLVNVDDTAETVGAVDHSLAAHDVIKPRCDFLLCMRVQIRCRFIKQENLSVLLQETASD